MTGMSRDSTHIIRFGMPRMGYDGMLQSRLGGCASSGAASGAELQVHILPRWRPRAADGLAKGEAGTVTKYDHVHLTA